MVMSTYSTPSNSTDQQINLQRYMKRNDRPHQKISTTLIKSYQDPYNQSLIKRWQNTIHTKQPLVTTENPQ